MLEVTDTFPTSRFGLANRLYAWEHVALALEGLEGRIWLPWQELEAGILELPRTAYRNLREDDLEAPVAAEALAGLIARPDRIYPVEVPIHRFDVQAGVSPVFVFEDQSTWNRHPLAGGPRPLDAIRLRADLAARLDEAFRDCARPVVGLHVRRGDYLPADEFLVPPHPERWHRRIPDGWYLRLAREVLTLLPEALFYLASDGTEEELQPFREELPLFGLGREIEEAIERFDRETPFRVEVRSATGRRTAPYSLARAVDLFALARCDFLIGSHSSGSSLAANLGRVPYLWPRREDQPVTAFEAFGGGGGLVECAERKRRQRLARPPDERFEPPA